MAVFNPNEPFDLVDYDPRWPDQYRAEERALVAALDEHIIEAEHIGSTAVPGLRAKPIIDILLVVEDFEPIDIYRTRLEPLGYTHHSHQDEADRLFFWKGVPRTHHVHIVEYATWEHQRHVIFRDYLRAHPTIADLYASVKSELIETFADNRPAYTHGKSEFIKFVTTRAMNEIKHPEHQHVPDDALNPRDFLSLDSNTSPDPHSTQEE